MSEAQDQGRAVRECWGWGWIGRVPKGIWVGHEDLVQMVMVLILGLMMASPIDRCPESISEEGGQDSVWQG